MTDKLPDIMTQQEWQAFIGTFNTKAPTGLRNAALFTLMHEAGLRSCEVIGLMVGDVRQDDLDGRPVTKLLLLGKGGKERVAYLSAEANGLLRRWLDARKALGLGRSKRVFTTLKGGLLAGAYLRELAARKGEEAGIGWRIHPHALRHTFATNLLRDTGNLALVQDALGHSDPETTRIYAKTVNSDLARALTRNDQQPEPAPAGPEALALAAKIAAMTPEQRQALTALLAGEPVASDGAQEATGSRQTGGVGVPRPITPAGPRKTRQKPTKTTDNAV